MLCGNFILLKRMIFLCVFFKSYESILLNFVTLLIVAEGTRLLREKRGQGRPRRSLRRGGSQTARGKRVPAAEINTRFFSKPKKQKMRAVLKSHFSVTFWTAPIFYLRYTTCFLSTYVTRTRS